MWCLQSSTRSSANTCKYEHHTPLPVISQSEPHLWNDNPFITIKITGISGIKQEIFTKFVTLSCIHRWKRQPADSPRSLRDVTRISARVWIQQHWRARMTKKNRGTRQRRLEWDISDEWTFEESQGRKDRFNHFWAMGRSRVAFHGQLFQPLQIFELRFGPKWGTDLDTSYQQCSAYYTCCLPSFFRKLQVGSSAAWLLMCTECNPQSPEPGLSVNQWRYIYNFSPCFNIIFNISWFGKWILFHILGMSSSQLTNIFFRG